MVNVAVAGASGYAGGELLRLLLAHPDVEIGALTAGSSAGTRLAQHHPSLFPLVDRPIEETNASVLAGHDVVFLALPHGSSAALAENLPDDVTVIDCGADFRLEREGDWTAFYDTPYAGCWAYGMPELVVAGGGKRRGDLVGSRRIAVPGCYPTATSLALAPLAAAGLIDVEDIVIVASSGVSGAGKGLKPHLLGAEVMGSMSPYGVGGVHRHTPEIMQNVRNAAGSGSAPVVSFTPTLAPMSRGILATSTARLRGGVDSASVRGAFDDVYGDEPFVTLLDDGLWPTTGAVLGSNMVALQCAVDALAGRVVVTAVVDNLTKGTAGAAVQSMNIALGLPETAGLPRAGVTP